MNPSVRRILVTCIFAVSIGGDTITKDAEAKPSSRQLVKADLILSQIEDELARTLPKELTIVSVSLPGSLSRGASSRNTISLRWRRPPTSGRSVVQVLVHTKTGRIKKAWTRVTLAEMGQVLVASGDIPAGTILSHRDLRIENRPLTSGRELTVSPSYVVGSRVVSSIVAGQPVLSGELVMPIPIARGTPVRVEVRRGGVVVTASGVLETKTKLGAATRVRVSGKLMSGKLVDEGTVLIGSSSRFGRRR